MANFARSSLALAVAALVGVGLTACGSSSSGATTGNVVAQVGGSPITKEAVNHWMSTLAGGDYYQLSAKHTVPEGLVSEPANYAACVAHLEAAAASSPKHTSKPSGLELLTKCRQLYQGLRSQAVAFLVNAQWVIGLDGEKGVTASDGEVLRLFNRIKTEEFPREAELQRYLASRRLSLADELFIVKLDLLAQKVEQKVAAGGKQEFARFTEAAQKWTAKTSCRAGYVVLHCKQFTGEPASSSPSVSVLMEQVAKLATGRCINFAACAKQ